MNDIAERTAEMMGYQYDDEFEKYTYSVIDPTGGTNGFGELVLDSMDEADWNPDKDISQAMQVAEWARNKPYYVRLEIIALDNSKDWLWRRKVGVHGVFVYGHVAFDQLPEAICLAILEAKDAQDE